MCRRQPGRNGISFWAERHEVNRRTGALDKPLRSFHVGVPEMIITRSPLRISLGGGGTDLPFVLSQPRRVPNSRGHRQVHLHHCSSPVCGWLFAEILPSRGGSQHRRNQTPDHQGSTQTCGHTGTKPGDRKHGRYPGRDGARLVWYFHNGAAQGPARVAQKSGAPV